MPYRRNDELPDNVKNVLPKHAQTIYREAFNNAWGYYKSPELRRGEATREKVAHKVAWAAVKSKYHKEEEKWVEN